MDYSHLVTEEGARESLIAISYGVVENIDYLPDTENAIDIKEVPITNGKMKTMEELRSELISIASFEPSTNYNRNESSTPRV